MVQQASEPSGLLIAGVLFGLVFGWIVLMGAVSLLRQHGLRGIVRGVAARWPARPAELPAGDGTASRPRQRKSRYLMRRRNGRFAGSAIVPNGGTTVPDPERRSGDRSAAGSPGTNVPNVPEVPETVLTVPDMLLITQRLAQGMAPSDVAKSLPGFSGRKYHQFMEKVQKTQDLLGAIEPAAAVPEPEPAAPTA